MVTISDVTLRANVYETIYDLLTAANLASSTVTVTGAYIDDGQHIPQVVINPIDKTEGEYTIDNVRNTSTKNLILTIDVFTKKSKQVDTICDEIDNLIRSTVFSGITIQSLESNVGAVLTPQNNKLHLTTITVNFKRR